MLPAFIPGNQVIQVLLLRMILDGIAGIKFLFELRPVHTIAIIRAHFSFYWYLPGMIKKRRNIYRREHNFGVRSIVWKYFILGKKKVKDL